MAGEILAAFRTVMLFISFSWLSIMYLLVYRVPRLEKSNQVYRAIENGIRSDNKKYFKRLEESFDGNIQIFGEDLPQIRWDLSNPRKKLLGRNNQTLQEFSSSDIPVSIRKVKKNLTEIHSQNIDFSSGDLDCRLLDTMETFEVLGSGYTKVVRRGVLAGKAIALKYTSEGNHDIVQCKTERPPERHFECFNLAKFKLLKEALLFRQLKHRNIVKLYGVCPWTSNDVEGSESVLTVITELGKAMNVIKLIQIPWDDRLRITIELVDLLIYLDDSPSGSLILKDFRIEQLILKDGVLKLTDLDDADGRKKPCKTRKDCFVGGILGNTTLDCIHKICRNFSATSNLYNLYKHILDYTLNYDNPKWLADDLKAIATRIKTFRVGLQDLLSELKRIAWKIKKGIYSREFLRSVKISNPQRTYERFSDASIIGANFDYYCLESRSLSSCEIAVSSIDEAKVTCSMTEECKAFVVTQASNWLGQSIIVLKNNGRSLTPITKHTTYVKGS